MFSIETVLQNNQKFVLDSKPSNLSAPPRLSLGVLSCMDARISMESLLGLKPGDAHVVRNAGGIATEDALRSLIASHHLMGMKEIMVINHTNCGMLSLDERALREKLTKETGISAKSPKSFLSFSNLEQNVLAQIRKIESHPWISASVRIKGFILDIKNRELKEVSS